jgi:aldehyde dehydrogenase (NAD+)
MKKFLNDLGIGETNSGATTGTCWMPTSGTPLVSYSPIDGSAIATVIQATETDYEAVMQQAQDAFRHWRMMPAPKRGEIVRQIGEALRAKKAALGTLVSVEMGKTLIEGLGEVQEMIDIADFAVGLSRQLYGKTMHSERPHHRMYEQWHPLGIVGVISAFNFPIAVWSWNALIAAVCGDVVLWKPSSKTPLTAIAIHNIIAPIMAEHNLEGVFSLVIGKGSEIGEKINNDRRIPLISATGSCRMGRRIGQAVAARLGRTILELGGNNAAIICADADMDMVVPAVTFGAIGTAGQRCTSTRRAIVHESRCQEFLQRITHAYSQIRIGSPLEQENHMGPLVDRGAVDEMMQALDAAKSQGASLVYGGEKRNDAGGCYVTPAIVRADSQLPIIHQETFAPILYVMTYSTMDEALQLHNEVDQGLSSSIFTQSMRTMETFLSHGGSDCGIANVNSGTNGAEIGGAFGGEKDTGGGREAGSDSWKAYMRRQTNTINWGSELPLAQGIDFSV